MNFLAHLHLSDIAGLPLSGAILGDVVRGRLEARDFPLPLERSIRLHRRIDVVTDAHPMIVVARSRFEPGQRRYGGILLDILYDHCLALDWSFFRDEPLEVFAARAAREVGDDAAWKLATGKAAPSTPRFERLLLSYRHEAGVDRSIAYVESRLKEPRFLHEASTNWRARIPQLREELPALLADLETTARDFAAVA